jgi:hypothetical protein
MAENRTSERPVAPAGEAGAPRRDPFSHGDLPMRPNYLPEEEEENGKRSELWNMVKAILVASAVIIALGLLLRR